MPVDDDTNYVVLAQEVLRRYGRGFTADNMADAWMDLQPKYAYCTAERVAFCNFVKGYRAPHSATYKNAFREWIGAQIRGDYFGYINPGNCEMAAEMAFRDASISHIKNGIYGEMFASAMIAAAAVCDNVKDVILCGLAEVPHTSRLYDSVEFGGLLDQQQVQQYGQDLFRSCMFFIGMSSNKVNFAMLPYCACLWFSGGGWILIKT